MREKLTIRWLLGFILKTDGKRTASRWARLVLTVILLTTGFGCWFATQSLDRFVEHFLDRPSIVQDRNRAVDEPPKVAAPRAPPEPQHPRSPAPRHLTFGRQPVKASNQRRGDSFPTLRWD